MSGLAAMRSREHRFGDLVSDRFSVASMKNTRSHCSEIEPKDNLTFSVNKNLSGNH